jgi:iron complex outermembrane receptor protein
MMTALAALLSAPAIAEEQTLEIPTVTVTAQKRSENVKQVPLNISVLSADALKDEHIEDYTDLARAVPGLNFQNVGGSGLNKIELRGVSSDSNSPTVSIYLDEVSVTMRNLLNTGATEPKFFDIDRVEVLRGPQGTLYGASSMGGTIRFISKQPVFDEFSGSAYLELSGTDHGGFNNVENVVVNAPLVPGKAAIRLGFQWSEDSGYIDHANPQTLQVDDHGVNGETTGVIRATVKLQPTDNLVITPALLIQRTRIDDTGVFYIQDVFGNKLPPLTQDKTLRERGRDTLFIPSLTADYDLGWADITSVSSYFYRQFNREQDGTYYNGYYLSTVLEGANTTALYPQIAAAAATNPASGASYLPQVAGLAGPAFINPTSQVFSQELRLASKSTKESGSPFTWVVGAYFSNQRIRLDDQEYVTGLNQALASIPGVNPTAALQASFVDLGIANPIPGSVFNNPAPGDLVYSNTDWYHEQQYSVFGEVSYNITPALKVSAGLRYIIGKESYSGISGTYYSADTPVVFGYQTTNYATTPKFAVTYDIDDNTTVYGNVSKGFRLGAFNQPLPGNCDGDKLNIIGTVNTPPGFSPDSLWSYEAGTKARVLDNRVSINAAIYYINWSNVQQRIYLPTCGYDYTANVGDAQSYGAELSVEGKVTKELSVNFSAGYTHATLTSSNFPQADFAAGSKLTGTPDFTINIGTVYRREISEDVSGFVRGDWQWIGGSHGDLSPRDPQGLNAVNPNFQNPAYSVLNASFGADIDAWTVSIFAKNLLNEGKTIQAPVLLSTDTGYTLRPLTVGMSIATEF